MRFLDAGNAGLCESVIFSFCLSGCYVAEENTKVLPVGDVTKDGIPVLMREKTVSIAI